MFFWRILGGLHLIINGRFFFFCGWFLPLQFYGYKGAYGTMIDLSLTLFTQKNPLYIHTYLYIIECDLYILYFESFFSSYNPHPTPSSVYRLYTIFKIYLINLKKNTCAHARQTGMRGSKKYARGLEFFFQIATQAFYWR